VVRRLDGEVRCLLEYFVDLVLHFVDVVRISVGEAGPALQLQTVGERFSFFLVDVDNSTRSVDGRERFPGVAQNFGHLPDRVVFGVQ
jgi:hypothetical protein